MSAVRLLPPLLKNLRLNALCLNYGRIYPSRLWSQMHRKCHPHTGKVCEGASNLTPSTNQIINTSAIRGAIGEPIATPSNCV